MLSAIRWPAVVLAVVLYFAIKKWDKHPIWYLGASALIGIVFHFSAL